MVSSKTIKNIEESIELFTMRETCNLLKVHANTLRHWDEKGILKAVRFGARKDRKYRKEDILNFISNKDK